jgi:uncharacterized protein (UPF0128 family)
LGWKKNRVNSLHTRVKGNRVGMEMKMQREATISHTPLKFNKNTNAKAKNNQKVKKAKKDEVK